MDHNDALSSDDEEQRHRLHIHTVTAAPGKLLCLSLSIYCTVVSRNIKYFDLQWMGMCTLLVL